MSYDFYSLYLWGNGSRFYKIRGKLKRGYVNKHGFYHFDKDTLIIYQGKDKPRKIIPIKPKSRFEYDAGRLKRIADRFFGRNKVDQIWKRGGFRVVGKKLIWTGRKKLSAKEVPVFKGVTYLIWERSKNEKTGCPTTV